jgi:hypothetical protein
MAGETRWAYNVVQVCLIILVEVLPFTLGGVAISASVAICAYAYGNGFTERVVARSAIARNRLMTRMPRSAIGKLFVFVRDNSAA